jgi:pimeloyl-ACP methyl ester carboxylesterase
MKKMKNYYTIISTVTALLFIGWGLMECSDSPLLQPLQTSPSGLVARSDLPSVLEKLGGRPCPEATAFTCVTIQVPLDHARPWGKMLPFRFAVHPAARASQGALVISEGGPGSPGISAVEAFLHHEDWLANDIDLIAYDLRGTGGSAAVECAVAKSQYERKGRSVRTGEEATALMQRAKEFSVACAREMGVAPDDLPFYDTQQAVQDLESMRQALGIEQLMIYGKSYGSQIAQIYGFKFPTHTRSIIIDGVVDMYLSHREYNQSVMNSVNNVLKWVLEACAFIPDCAADFAGDPQGAFKRVTRKLEQGPMPYTFIHPSGRAEARTFTRAHLDMATVDALASFFNRLLFLRALAAADRLGDYLPLGRLAFTMTQLDPATYALQDHDASQAIYHAIVCNDCGRSGADPDEAARAWVASAQQFLQEGSPLVSGLLLDLPCCYWPSAKNHETAPSPGTSAQIPYTPVSTLIIGAEADPLTPMDQALAVFERREDAKAILVSGGQHVMWTRGSACVDDAVQRFVLGQASEKVTRCQTTLLQWYKALPPVKEQLQDASARLASVEREIYFLPELELWDHRRPLTIGCGKAGTVSLEAERQEIKVRFSGCSFVKGIALSGEGRQSEFGRKFEGKLRLLPQGAQYTYRLDEDQISVTPLSPSLTVR